MAAGIYNKQEASICSNSSMGNLLALMINGGAGTEVLCASNLTLFIMKLDLAVL